MRPKKIALIGNPNSGKTTLFNRLTRMNYREGNYSGVTVESCFGSWVVDADNTIEVVDLPGCYSLQPFAQDGQDMRETIKTINTHAKMVMGWALVTPEDHFGQICADVQKRPQHRRVHN